MFKYNLLEVFAGSCGIRRYKEKENRNREETTGIVHEDNT
jgi:hypothetical protein